ncbi:MAG: helix-turn-helix domain-containing protein [Sphaerochaeta sp.]
MEWINNTLTGFTLLVYTIAFAIGCMALALVIVFIMQTKHVWTKYLIICHSSLLGSMMISAMFLLGKVFIDGWTVSVLNIVLSAIQLADIAFLIVFIPYFITWIIAVPWRSPYKQIFTVLAVIYILLGSLRYFYDSSILEIARFFIFAFVIAFSFIIMLNNLSSIKLQRVRLTSKSIIITSVALLPFMILGLLNVEYRFLVEGLYFLAWSIILIIFFFNYFANQKVAKDDKKDLTLDSLEQFHITQREFSVIQLIAKGKTNKEIASELGISVNTVNNHVANIFTKTEVRSRIDLLNLIRDAW